MSAPGNGLKRTGNTPPSAVDRELEDALVFEVERRISDIGAGRTELRPLADVIVRAPATVECATRA